MKKITLPAFNPSRSATEQFSEHFARCGLNADWSPEAFHLSKESITGHKPNTTDGDFYLIENEDHAGGWLVVIRTGDQTEEVAGCLTAAEMWQWLADPVSQAFYLHADENELAIARGIKPSILAGQVVRILAEFQDAGDDEFIWVAADDEEKGRVTIMPLRTGLTVPPRQTVEAHMVESVMLNPNFVTNLKKGGDL